MYRTIFYSLLLAGLLGACAAPSRPAADVTAHLAYCTRQVKKALPALEKTDRIPRNITGNSTAKNWNCTPVYDWTSGFWPGILWYVYEETADPEIRAQAERFTGALFPVADRPADNHDLGFMLYCSAGNGYRLTGNPAYKAILLRAADSLATLYNARVGTLCSWPGMRKKMHWPHNTIIDNMLNLELLFWASKNGGDKNLYAIAERHAEVTRQNQFRPDHTTCHVVVYDTITGHRLQQVTHQGYSDSSTWARGQAWAIYGFTMCYRETGNPAFLQTARQAADAYLARLPADYIPYWDFDTPDIPHTPRDASAAAVTASGLLELCRFTTDKQAAARYKAAALHMLASLSGPSYRSGETNVSFLLHSTGHYPNGSEIDASIIYADYYYIEALTRLKQLEGN